MRLNADFAKRRRQTRQSCNNNIMGSVVIQQFLNELLGDVASYNASDLHLSVGHHPILRVDGSLVSLKNLQRITPDLMNDIVSLLITEQERIRLDRLKEMDFSYNFENKLRFRVNVYFQKGYLSVAMRMIPTKIRTLEELRLPPTMHDFTNSFQGFLLVVGPSGHGKSTTLAALINEINHTRASHIITIEDPIEYLFTDDLCIIDQREVHRDTNSFQSALRAIFREDPNVVMVGEMRDSETISTAITAAETGHLVLATLHTNNAAQTIDRIIDSFSSNQQNQIRMQLAGSLIGIISQRLIPSLRGGRVPAVEILKVNSAIKNLIRENKTHQIDMIIETGLNEGMITLNRSLANLVKRGDISFENAQTFSYSPGELKTLI